MNKSQNIILFLILSIGTASSSFFFNSCTTKTDVELLNRLDSLDYTLAKTGKMLDIDVQVIENRKNQMLAQEMFIRKYLLKTMTEESGQMLSKYRNISKVYKKFTKGYSAVKIELDSMLPQAKSLRQDVENGVLSKSDFKEYFSKEMYAARLNENKATNIAKNINSLEPEYQRISAYVIKFIDGIALRQPKVKEAREELRKSHD